MSAPNVTMIAQRHLHQDAEGSPALSRWLRTGATTAPDHRMEKPRIPGRCQPERLSVQIPIFVFNARLVQKLHQLLSKRHHAMMPGLVRDVFPHFGSCRRAHREGYVSFLPRKLEHDVRQAMRGLQSDKQMHVVSNTANTLNKPAEPADRYTQVFVKALTPGSVDQWIAALGGKHYVVMQSEKSRGHGGASCLTSPRDTGCFRRLPAGIESLNQVPSASRRDSSHDVPLPRRRMLESLRDAFSWRTLSGGVASLYHRLIAGMPSAS